jgi:hypothetical protein
MIRFIAVVGRVEIRDFEGTTLRNEYLDTTAQRLPGSSGLRVQVLALREY